MPPGDLVIIPSYGICDDEARAVQPTVVHVNTANEIVLLGVDPAEQVPGDRGQLREDVVNAAEGGSAAV